MGRTSRGRRSGRWLRWPALFLLGFTGACAAGRPLPLPFPATEGKLPDRETLIDLGRRQAYDTNPGASDRAMVEDGIEVTIEPQDGTFRQSRARLARGSIVAQFRNNSQRPLPAYALEPGGRSFWVVYRKGEEWYSAYIADSKNSKLDRYDVPTIIHPPSRPWRQSIAQWQLAGVLDHSRPGGEDVFASEVLPWTTCVDQGCCKGGN